MRPPGALLADSVTADNGVGPEAPALKTLDRAVDVVDQQHQQVAFARLVDRTPHGVVLIEDDLHLTDLREVSPLVTRYSVHHMISALPGESALS